MGATNGAVWTLHQIAVSGMELRLLTTTHFVDLRMTLCVVDCFVGCEIVISDVFASSLQLPCWMRLD